MNFKQGDKLKDFEVQVDKYQPYYYAGASGDYNAIHIDDEYAKKAGLGGIILQGLCTMAYVYRAVVKDEDPGKLKRLKVRFRSIVKPLDTLTVKGQVSGLEKDTLTFDIIVANQKEEQVITNALVAMQI